MFLIDSEILCNPKISDEDDIRVDTDFTQFPIDNERIRIKLKFESFKGNWGSCSNYEDYAVHHFNGIDGEMISYHEYMEDPEVKEITSDELYKYFQ